MFGRKWICALALAMPFYVHAGKAGLSVGEYKAYQIESRDTMTIYVHGVWAGIFWDEAKRTANNQKPLYCPPKNLVVTGDDVVALLDKKILSEDFDDVYPIALIVLDVVRETYPCKK
jgi:hypothetical protein